MEEMTGVPAAKMLGKGDFEYAIPFYGQRRQTLIDLVFESDEVIAKRYEHIIRDKDILIADTTIPLPDGKTITIMGKASPLYNRHGEVIGAIESIRDITEHKNAEELVRESEMKYRMLFEGSRDAMLIIEPPAFRFTSCNAAAREMFGIKDEAEFILMRPWDLSPETQPDGQPSAKKALAMIDIAIRTGSHFFEWTYRRSNGEIFPCTVLVSKMIISGRTVLQATVRDITAMKQAEEALREANKKLNLLSSITRHDINNLLMVIRVYTQLAAVEKPDAVIADFLAKIASAVDTIQHQIEFTRTYQELGMQAPAWFRLCEMIRSVRPPDIMLVCTCEPSEIFADPMISKVFFNLFDNAVKYGERVTTVTVGCEQAGDELVITFTGNGIGIPLNEKQKIFGKGYGRNTGFGLFLAREILAITGITIYETGSYGKGARFEITVPKGAYRFP
jgi:PAS domain S-box-containing protein